jgi:ABC-type histidine transport system ATPase subunit
LTAPSTIGVSSSTAWICAAFRAVKASSALDPELVAEVLNIIRELAHEGRELLGLVSADIIERMC